MASRLKAIFKDTLVRSFHLGQRLGVDILPRHFYSEIPSIAKLQATEHWRRPYSMVGVRGWNADEQLAFVRGIVTPEVARYLAEHDVREEAGKENGAPGYGSVEAQVLFAFVATRRPQRIVQIGCGVSTAICIAAGKFSGYRPEITCVEPYPTDFLKRAAERGDIRLIPQAVEVVGLEFFNHLRDGDLFFVDSTHTLGPAGEVTRIIVEMLPRLARGAYVHFHDIYLPYDYTPWILSNAMFFWHESPLLHAFLCMNGGYTVRTSLSLLHHERPAELRAVLPRYQPMPMNGGLTNGEGDFPSSIYLQALGESPNT